MLPFANLLPDTTSAKNRGYRWEPADAAAGFDGTLTYQAKEEFARYRVTEFPTDLAGRAFRCEKVRGGSDKEETAYDVLTGDAGEPDACTCKGFQRYQRCRHLDCLRDLLAEGRLPSPLANADADVGPTEPTLDDWQAAGEWAFETLAPAEYAAWLSAPYLIPAGL
jgi:hypothetical protein